jgi:hypothetical protein
MMYSTDKMIVLDSGLRFNTVIPSKQKVALRGEKEILKEGNNYSSILFCLSFRHPFIAYNTHIFFENTQYTYKH